MNELQIFQNENFSVRTFNENSDIWFVAKDVAGTLEYSDASNPSRLFQSVPDIWKGVKPIHTLGGEQEMLCLTEQGLYFFLGRSDKPKALPYQMWIAGDVVPSIRKTGRYSISLLNGTFDFAKSLYELAGLKDNQLVLAMDKVYQRHFGYSALTTAGIPLKAAELERLLTPTEIGKELGESARLVNALLLGMSYQRKVVNGYEPIGDGKTYGVMLDVGKSHSDGTPVRQLKWKSSIIDVLRQEIS